jgi:hypothetical protein
VRSGITPFYRNLQLSATSALRFVLNVLDASFPYLEVFCIIFYCRESMQNERPQNVGILAMEAYFPQTFVSQEELGKN